MNAWYLNKYRVIYRNESMIGKSKGKKESLINKDNDKNKKINDRKKIINLMLLNASLDHQYMACLKELYNLEDEQDEEELVYGW